MINDDRFLNTPNLPQYGDLRGSCYASLPGSGAARFVYVIAGLGYLVVFGAVLQVAMRLQVADPRLKGVFVAVAGIVLLFVARWAVKKIASGFKQQALFVYDGGVHLNEDVTYLVSYGRSFQVCSGIRQVSIPWRMLTKFSAQEVKRKGEPAVEASFVIPDGRKLTVSTIDGKQSGTAIEALLNKLG